MNVVVVLVSLLASILASKDELTLVSDSDIALSVANVLFVPSLHRTSQTVRNNESSRTNNNCLTTLLHYLAAFVEPAPLLAPRLAFEPPLPAPAPRLAPSSPPAVLVLCVPPDPFEPPSLAFVPR